MSISEAVAFIRRKIEAEHVDVALILGSGLGAFAEQIKGVSIDYADIPGFPRGGVSGHAPKLIVGTLGTANVAVFGGRMHYYEQGQADVMRFPLEVSAELGVREVILTNSAGSVRDSIQPGDLMQITDHLNFSGLNPLIGEETDKRFVALADAYDPAIMSAMQAAAKRVGHTMHKGVYTWFSGPSFETPAEIRATQVLGGDAVGMSTVPEVILARFLGLKVGAISTITNMGAGMSNEKLSHEHTKSMAPVGAAKLSAILTEYFRSYQPNRAS
ncbi:purine-nucleoside phosphorylase [uncultured Ruegeria sp.]|uniref:purine-nucleoside phosphorylase n=1 Tax=uncultured Ruegeria sp. TaxID=259304 RepID=UPI002605E150|nr:purine-nucleoside phosphorylase [uncultured Ruegeria sp.]